jgi:hypothetical protein
MGKKDEKAFNNASQPQSLDAAKAAAFFSGESPTPGSNEDKPIESLEVGEVPKDKGNFRSMTGQGD